MIIVWEYKICYTFIIFIRHRTAENNQRHLSYGFKNILFGDNMHYVDLYVSVFLVKAELRKFGEVRSHPPHPPGYATGEGGREGCRERGMQGERKEGREGGSPPNFK